MLKRFYEKNKFYSWLLAGILLVILILDTAIICFSENPNYPLIGKIWVIASSVLTAFYTAWFWARDKGRCILNNISDAAKRGNKVECVMKICVAVFLLIAIAVANIWTYNNNHPLFQLGTILLMVLTFALFCWIDKIVIANYDKKKTKDGVKRDFEYTLNNSDIPGVFSFSFLAIYFLLFLFLAEHPMELFFSGAIAFQMLFSSIVWANTEVTDVEKKQNE